jgi:hypothetical protein
MPEEAPTIIIFFKEFCKRGYNLKFQVDKDRHCELPTWQARKKSE